MLLHQTKAAQLHNPALAARARGLLRLSGLPHMLQARRKREAGGAAASPEEGPQEVPQTFGI